MNRSERDLSGRFAELEAEQAKFTAELSAVINMPEYERIRRMVVINVCNLLVVYGFNEAADKVREVEDV